jgi:hypothetical protein
LTIALLPVDTKTVSEGSAWKAILSGFCARAELESPPLALEEPSELSSEVPESCLDCEPPVDDFVDCPPADVPEDEETDWSNPLMLRHSGKLRPGS